MYTYIYVQVRMHGRKQREKTERAGIHNFRKGIYINWKETETIET